jgi:hypothetical protein
MSEEALSKTINWTERLEELLSEAGERAHCYSWLHKRSEEHYSRLSIVIELPPILLGVLNGAASVGSNSLFGDNHYAPIVIGGIVLLTSLLNTISSYFSWSKRAEGHKLSSLQYARLYRFISVELSLPREERMSPGDFLKYMTEHYNRLAEMSPLIPNGIMNDFKRKFSSGLFKDITKPEEAGDLKPIYIYKDTIIEVPPPSPIRIVEMVKTPFTTPRIIAPSSPPIPELNLQNP